MTDKLLIAPPEAEILAEHLNEWAQWRQTADTTTADRDWDRFIEKSRQKAQWEAGLATEIDHWESLHALQMALADKSCRDDLPRPYAAVGGQ